MQLSRAVVEGVLKTDDAKASLQPHDLCYLWRDKFWERGYFYETVDSVTAKARVLHKKVPGQELAECRVACLGC